LFIAGTILHSDRFQVPFFIFTFVLPDFCTLFLYAIFLLILKTCTLFLCDFFRYFFPMLLLDLLTALLLVYSRKLLIHKWMQILSELCVVTYSVCLLSFV
jgi:hypothetical protein